LSDRGFRLAAHFLDDASVRARIDRTCANARSTRTSVWAAGLQLSSIIDHANKRFDIDAMWRWTHDQRSFGSNALST
jgi:uncharacterized protein RhaS with RHS repeats